MKYKVHIEEALSRDVVVEATSLNEAETIVQRKLDNEEIILTADDYTGERFVYVNSISR